MNTQTISASRGDRSEATGHRQQGVEGLSAARQSSGYVTAETLQPVIDRVVVPCLQFTQVAGAERATLVQAYHADQVALKNYDRKLAQIVSAIFLATIDNRTKTAGKIDTDDYIKAQTAAVFEHAPPMKLFQARHSLPEFVAMPEKQLALELGRVIGGGVKRLVERVVHALNVLHERGLAGKIEWYGRDVCELTYARTIVTDRVLRTATTERTRASGVRRIIESTTDTDIETKSVLQLNTHRLLKAEVHELPADYVPKPVRIAKLVGTLVETRLLMPVTSIVTGDQYDGSVVETCLSTKVKTVTDRVIRYVHCEPGIIIGDLVLAGWDPSEVERGFARIRRLLPW